MDIIQTGYNINTHSHSPIELIARSSHSLPLTQTLKHTHTHTRTHPYTLGNPAILMPFHWLMNIHKTLINLLLVNLQFIMYLEKRGRIVRKSTHAVCFHVGKWDHFFPSLPLLLLFLYSSPLRRFFSNFFFRNLFTLLSGIV